jgi:hypothetical protein
MDRWNEKNADRSLIDGLQEKQDQKRVLFLSVSGKRSNANWSGNQPDACQWRPELLDWEVESSAGLQNTKTLVLRIARNSMIRSVVDCRCIRVVSSQQQLALICPGLSEDRVTLPAPPGCCPAPP